MYFYLQRASYETSETLYSQLMWRWVEGFEPDGIAIFRILDFVAAMINFLLIEIDASSMF